MGFVGGRLQPVGKRLRGGREGAKRPHLCVEGVDDDDAEISVQARNVAAAHGVANLKSRKSRGGSV